MSIEQGEITNVVIDDSGTELVADAAIGATTLFVAETYPFNLTGGTLELKGVPHNYSAVDYELNTITVSPLTVAGLAEDKVYVLPRGSVKVAMVNFEDGDEGIRAIVPFEMVTQLDDGIRDYSEREQVFVSDETGRWELKALDEEIPTQDASYINPETFPDDLGGPTEPPGISPEIDVTATAESFVIEADPVEPSTEIIYEISEDFDEGAGTGTWVPLAGTPTKSTVYVVAAPPSGGTFVPDQTYGFRAIATNGIPPDPAPSTAVGAALNPDLMNQLVTARLVAGFILGETIQVGAITINANDGIRIPQPNGKQVHFPADGSIASITAALVATALTIEGNSFVYGLMQVFAKILLPAGVPTPTEQPQLTAYYPFTETGITSPGDISGMCDTPAGTHWAVLRGSTLQLLNKGTGVLDGSVTLTGMTMNLPLSVTMMGGKYYVLWQLWSPLRQFISRFSSTGVFEAHVTNNAPSVITSNHPALGTDGTNLYLAWVHNELSWRVATIDPTDGSVDATVITDLDANANLYYVGRGNFDFGAARIVIGRDTGGSVRVFSTAGVTQAASNFNRAATVRGMVWDGTRFLSLSDTGRLYRHAQRPVIENITVSYDWGDEDGSPRTEDSPSLAVSIPARAWARVEASPAPQANDPGTDKAERVGVYATVGGSLLRQAILALGQTIYDIDNVITGGVAPASSNGFDAIASPGIIESGARAASGKPHIDLRGDGTARMVMNTQRGAVASGTMVAETNKLVAVVFPVPFPAIPDVSISLRGIIAGPSGTAVMVSYTNVSETGFDACFRRTTGTTELLASWNAGLPTEA